jgi:hypothetical protein
VKTKYTVNVANIDIELNGQKFERVDTFKYLGSIITSENEIEYDIKDKISAANRCFPALNNMLSRRYISKNTKIRTHKTVISKANYTIQL